MSRTISTKAFYFTSNRLATKLRRILIHKLTDPYSAYCDVAAQNAASLLIPSRRRRDSHCIHIDDAEKISLVSYPAAETK